MKNNIFIVTILACLGAFGYFAYNQELLLFRFPSFQKNSIEVPIASITKKKVNRIYWNNDVWRHEDTELLWPENISNALLYLITSWLALLDEEKIMDKKVTVQSVIVSPSQNDVYISFDRNPFTKKQSTYEKLMWIEGILKTIRETGTKVQNIHFLVHHQPVHDFHLDFSNPWPVTGFVENS